MKTKIIDNFLQSIHYICDFEYWWVRPGEAGREAYQQAYRKEFGNKPDFEPLGDGWYATYRSLYKCKKCGKVVSETNTSFI